MALPAGFFRNVASLAGGTVIAQLIMLAALPVVTRLYSPDAFGYAAYFLNVGSILAAVSTLRYEYAIVLPGSARAAFHVAVVALAASLPVIAAALVVAVIAGLPPLLLAIAVASGAAFGIVSRWAERHGDFAALGLMRIRQGLAGAASQIGLGLLGAGSTGLIVAQLVAQAFGGLRLARDMIRTRPPGRVSARGLAWAARRYRHFPLVDGWAGILFSLGAYAPAILFAVLFSPTIAGYYALATRILTAPNALVGAAISRVLLPEMARRRRGGDIAGLTRRTASILAWTMVPYGIGAMIAPALIGPVFGAQWQPAAAAFTWTSLWVAWQLVASPLSVVLLALERQGLNLLLQSALLALRATGIGIGVVFGSPDLAIILFSLASITGYFLMLAVIGRVIGRQILSALAAPLAVSVAILPALAWLLERWL